MATGRGPSGVFSHLFSPFLWLILSGSIHLTAQNVRHKRDANSNQPSIVTQNGHLIFQTASNHNITFQSSAGGFININGDNLQGISQNVKDNAAAIQQLQQTPTLPPNLGARLRQTESRLNNLQPTGQVATSLNDLTSRMNSVENSVPDNVDSRISQVESRLSNLQPTGQVGTTLQGLTTQIQALATRVNTVESVGTSTLNTIQARVIAFGPGRRGATRRIGRRVQTLATTVASIQTMLWNNECANTPCGHGGTCIDTYNSFVCLCARNGWTGPTCHSDINECYEYAGSDLGCKNGGQCVNTPGSYRCICVGNWHGPHCADQHNSCSGANGAEICGHGTCINQPSQTPAYTCICDEGWMTDPQSSDLSCSQDVDECQDPSPHCSTNPPVTCINYPGSFACAPCPAGYSGNGYSCTDINECETNNGGCSRAPHVDCINTRGSRRCGPCPTGYQGNGVTCTWVGVCNQNNGGCHPMATCVENPGVGPSFRACRCPAGYTGNGVGPTGCVPDSTAGPCANRPCQNGGACRSTGTSYTCACQAGYTGRNCETDFDECSSSPCNNGGTCTDRINGFVCGCTDQWSGPTCDDPQETCGGALRGETGSLAYPRQTGTTYPHGLSCAWSITTTRGKILMVSFSRFNMEFHLACNYDFLQIHDGPTASSHMIGKYCGTDLPNGGSLNSTHHQLYLWLRTDASITADGFALSWQTADPVCGGEISADFGSINSPGYPGVYPHNRDCVWTISVTPGNNIMFTFATLALETHPNCTYDYLEIRDGLLDTSAFLNRYCTTMSPPPITTTGPYAWVKFHSDVSLNDRGFHITFAKVQADNQCGGVLTDESGIITSPDYPSPYQHNAQCVWTLTVSAGDTISLTFTNMEIESHSSCQFDYVEVRDGIDEEANLIGRYCGTTIPAVLTTTQNRMFVKFKSDVSIRGTGFRATYTVACGGVFTAPTGTLQSPFYPNAYPSNKECTYMISQQEGYTITLIFQTFDVEGSTGSSCSFDYLEVRDGGTATATLLGRFCGNTIPSAQSSTNNVMFLKFVTDGNQGFSASYTSNEGSLGCGGTLTDMTGTVESPGHPNTYPHGANCTWFISVPSGLIIRLTFHIFSIESHSRCRYDSVEIFDNSTLTYPGSSLGKFCGSAMPPVLTSYGNTMTILFISDVSISREGFSASYTALNASTVCGGVLTDNVGVIMSPNYPGNYPHTRECIWTIVLGAGKQILLNVTNFHMENHPNCNYDYLEIRNGGFITSPLIGKYCGTNVDPIIRSHSNRMYLKFRSDSSQSARGFRIVYDGTASGCGADLTTPTGSFVSPNYPIPYSHNGECFWTITTSRGSKLQLVFIDFNLESHSICRYDYVQVRDGDVAGRELAKICGNQVPDPIFSNTNRLWVKFRSDTSVSGRGFHAAYYSVCETTLTDRNGVIESPNFPDPYPHNRNCTWIIQTTLGNTINASFSHFDIESHTSCRYDYLQIRDGRDETAPELMKLCGRNLPDIIATTQQYMWVHFLSDASVAGNGFRLEYVTNGCGAALNTPTGHFTSPNWPQSYPHRRVCEWSITVASGSAIKLTITDFDLEAHVSCRYDSLEVYGGPDDSAPRLSKLCNPITSAQILTSTGNTMFVRFTSDSSIAGRGFQADYETVTGGCGGNFTAQNGLISSKNYPSNYPHNTDCEWLITLEQDQLVVLTFTDFDVEGSSTCRYDYVAVYDGNRQSNGTELMHYCGNTLPDPSIIRTNGNQMFIRMRTDASVSRRGFQASYIAGCGGSINADIDGVVTSPNYPENYDMASNCTWLLRAQQTGERITLTFTHMDVEDRNSCGRDYVTVLDGDSATAPQLNTFCGTTIPSTITSQGSALFIIFVSDNSGQRSGFRTTYSTSVSSCGADFTAENGAFNSPNYPLSYPINTECVWSVRTSPGNRVLISFSVFNLENHPQCNYDYLEVREGNMTGNLIGRYCGNTTPSNITALNGVWMKFRSDGSATGIGFMAQYNTLHGGAITGSSGQIASPLYPNQYPHNVDYTWTITVAVGMRIRITFMTMDMEGSQTCNFDYVRFRDGGSATSPLLGSRYCGTTLPNTFISTTNQLRVEFHTDFSSTGQGFLLNWGETSLVLINSTTVGPSTTGLPGCGGILIAGHDMANFSSPGYPSRYTNNLNCIWRINAEAGHRIWLNITDIDLESHSSCRFDVITIFDSYFSFGSYLGSQMGTFCGRNGNDNPIIVMGNKAMVKFTTDNSVTRRGFSIAYQSTCGGRIRNTPTGELHSPNYPSNYDNGANCTWIIQVSAGRTIQATFSAFNIQSSTGCSNDYIMFLNGGNADSPPLSDNNGGRFCGSSVPTVAETASNYMYVSFVTDGSGMRSGFSMTWSEVSVTCGGSLSLTDAITSGIFMSPNWPANYPHNVDCIWVITAPAAESIQVDMDSIFNIETHSSCRYDYIEFRDGGTANAALIGKYCGTTPPSTVRSSGNVLYARFRTDNSVPRVGFKATYQIATCGGTVNGVSGSIQSPNYPAAYDNNADCEWFVTGPTGHYVTFTFEAFNLQSSSNCTRNDMVEIREMNATGSVLFSGCGSSIPASIDTSDSFAYIHFKSDASVTRTGFKVNFQASVEECGGDLTTPTGTFTSPNYPGRYAHSRNCEWRIQVQPGRRVTLNFDAFQLEDNSVCRWDYIDVFNGVQSGSPRITRLCGETTPAPVESSGNSMRVVFRTDGSVSNGGFSASYSSSGEAVCGSVISTSTSGNLSSPGYSNGSYANNQQCIWLLQNRNEVNSSITLRFLDFSLESHGTCRYDFLEIREGTDENAPLLSKLCGNNTTPVQIISPSPNLWLRFTTDRSIVDRGFDLQYRFTSCGGLLTDESGTITSPNYPNNYNHNDACSWLISAPEGNQITMTFVSLNIEPHTNCAFDYLDVLNGGLASSPSIGRFCGTNITHQFTSQSNQLRVEFRTDFSQAHSGFMLTYRFSAEGCGGLFHANDGYLTTPNYPNRYPHNIECIWTVNVASGYHVSLSFNAPFNMEGGSCRFDYVQISDVLTNGTQVPMGRYCSNIVPPVQVSSGNQLILKLRTDSSVNANGFSANWTTGCGATFTTDSGIILSPGYPGNYDNRLMCNYTILVDPQKFVILEFDQNNFNLEGGNRCPFDAVSVYMGNDTSGRSLGRFCGTTAPQPLSSRGSMFIQFKTDGSVVNTGFRATFRTDECGGQFTDPTGTITSPTHPTNYHHNLNCTYNITVMDNHVVELKFTQFNLEAHSRCNFDYVEVRDGNSFDAPLLGRFCGATIPTNIKTTTNSMLVTFKTDSSVSRTGFHAVYRTTIGPAQGCGGVLNGSSGSFSSPDIDGDGRYENNLDCIWQLFVSPDKVVQLSIPNMRIENVHNCFYDYLEIRDGISSDDYLVGKFCGTQQNYSFTSASNAVYIRFFTDGSVVLPGFNISYTSVPALCGGAVAVNDTAMMLSSPGYPSPFNQQLRCRWTLDAPARQNIRLSMNDINILDTSSCGVNYVEFRDSPLGERGRSVHYCGSGIPQDFDSIGRTVQVNYVSAPSQTGRGFQLTYQIAGCNRTFTGDNGRIVSPGWPASYPHNARCGISITTANNTYVALYFNDFAIEAHSNCNFDYLQVNNGSDEFAPMVGKFCGRTLPDPIYATGNSLYLFLKTDSSVTTAGYDISYTSSPIPMGCGGNLTSINGSFTSPGYPGNYTEARTCDWLISVPARRRLRVEFPDFGILGTPNCLTDYVELRNGGDITAELSARFCGDSQPAVYAYGNNQFFLRFFSDGTGSAIYFKLKFTS